MNLWIRRFRPAIIIVVIIGVTWTRVGLLATTTTSSAISTGTAMIGRPMLVLFVHLFHGYGISALVTLFKRKHVRYSTTRVARGCALAFVGDVIGMGYLATAHLAIWLVLAVWFGAALMATGFGGWLLFRWGGGSARLLVCWSARYLLLSWGFGGELLVLGVAFVDDLVLVGGGRCSTAGWCWWSWWCAAVQMQVGMRDLCYVKILVNKKTYFFA